MNHPRQRIAIARMCGWKSLPKDPAMIQYTAQKPDGKWDLILDYPSDLNAIQEECMLLSDDAQTALLLEICEIAERDGTWPILATASQRSEAFLKTLGLWEEENVIGEARRGEAQIDQTASSASPPPTCSASSFVCEVSYEETFIPCDEKGRPIRKTQ